jgi:hypothetical protein
VVLDADSNKVETPFQDLESLPLDVVGIFLNSYSTPISSQLFSFFMMQKFTFNLFVCDLLLLCTSICFLFCPLI